jgi:hypothetical protein
MWAATTSASMTTAANNQRAPIMSRPLRPPRGWLRWTEMCFTEASLKLTHITVICRARGVVYDTMVRRRVHVHIALHAQQIHCSNSLLCVLCCGLCILFTGATCAVWCTMTYTEPRVSPRRRSGRSPPLCRMWTRCCDSSSRVARSWWGTR